MKVSDFSSVLGAAAREDVLLPELESALKQRFESKKLDINIIYILLFKTNRKGDEWVALKKSALKYVTDTQGSAAQLLNMLQQKNIIDRFEFEYDNKIDSIGAKVILEIKGKTIANPEFKYSKRKKDAVNLCTTDILQKILALPESDIKETDDILYYRDRSKPRITDLKPPDKTEDKSINKLKEHFANGEYNICDNIDGPNS